MIGFGTIVNVVAILAGGLLGRLFGSRLQPRYQTTLTLACGLSVIFLGIAGCMEKMLQITQSGLTSSGTMMVIGSYCIGALVGEWLNLEDKITRFGEWLKRKTKSDRDNGFVDAFVTASLTVCVGAMAVVGSIQDGILGDYSTLAAKAVLDFIIILVMSASMGRGCIFSAIPVGLFQGSITLLSRLIQPLMTEAALNNLSLTGSMLIFCVGVNLVWGKKFPVANLLPTIFVAVAWSFLPF